MFFTFTQATTSPPQSSPVPDLIDGIATHYLVDEIKTFAITTHNIAVQGDLCILLNQVGVILPLEICQLLIEIKAETLSLSNSCVEYFNASSDRQKLIVYGNSNLCTLEERQTSIQRKLFQYTQHIEHIITWWKNSNPKFSPTTLEALKAALRLQHPQVILQAKTPLFYAAQDDGIIN